MKPVLINISAVFSFVILLPLAGFAQQSYSVETMLKIYASTAAPFFQQMVEREYGGKGTTDKEKIMIHARYELLVAKTRLVKKDVTEQLEKLTDRKPDKPLVHELIEASYRQHYTGLPKEFFDKARKAS
jgi:hypothetical protein